MSIARSEQPTVFVIDDDADVRNGVKQLVESAGLRCEVFTSPNEFLQRYPTNGPSCLILDVRLREMSGLDLLDELGKDIPTVMITGYGDIPMAARAMTAGAANFLTKPLREQDLLDTVYAGLKQHRAQIEKKAELTELRARFQNLTPREQEIFPLVTTGLLNKQIAAKVDLSEVTVKVHRHKLMVKLNAKNLPDLVRMAEALAIPSGGSSRGKNAEAQSA
jgi:FixJ family two-component response regulator